MTTTNKKTRSIVTASALAIAAVTTSMVMAENDPPECHTLKFVDGGWTDVSAATGLASTVLTGLGYKPTRVSTSIQIAFASIANKQVDAFFGYWSPTMDGMVAPFVQSGGIKILPKPNLSGAKYTLAVPDYVYDAGLETFDDLAKYKDQLGEKLYGLEAGNDGNVLISKMIKDDQFGLKDFRLVDSSEAAMLVQVDRAIRQKKWIVFLGWDPHPMNVRFNIKYLSGGDEIFGPNYGEARVNTVVRNDLDQQCPNAAKLLSNLQFTPDMESHVMIPILNKESPDKAAHDWLKANPEVLTNWLAGVTTVDGKPGEAAVRASLGL